ncbi:hypothetical protein B0H13DRAFT_2019920 [Mycena leptocephala]|nr:hypothetical protein B0H13DRAFT_2019920 [Mycena leptocephala]
MSTSVTIPSPAELQESFGVLFTGYALCIIAYGFTFFQTYIYFSRSANDSLGLKTSMLTLFILDTAASILLSNVIYFYMATSFPYSGGLVLATRALTSYFFLSALIMFVTQLVYVNHVWKSTRNWFISGAIGGLASAAFCFAVAMIILIFKDPVIARWSQRHIMVVIALTHTFTLLAALLIFGAMTMDPGGPENHRQFGYPKPLYAIFVPLIPHGLLGAGMQFACLVVFVVRPHKIMWIPFHLVANKGFVNGVLNMINAQAVYRDSGATGQDIKSAAVSNIVFTASEPQTSHTIDISPTVQETGSYVHPEMDKGGYAGTDDHHLETESNSTRD